MSVSQIRVFLLHREISDQYGTDELVGVYSTREKAESASASIKDRRSFIREEELDPEKPREKPYYLTNLYPTETVYSGIRKPTTEEILVEMRRHIFGIK